MTTTLETGHERQPLIDVPNYYKIRDEFSRQLQLCSEGRQQDTSLPFIHNPLPSQSLVAEGELFQAFAIGGTNGAIAHVKAQPDKQFSFLQSILNISPLPIFETAEDFAEFIRKHNTYARVIGINFAYELVPQSGNNGELDGIMNQGKSKGSTDHAFTGLQGKLVGQTISNYIRTKEGRNIIVTVANDTVCLATAGLQEIHDKSIIIAGIVGTGYNFAFYLNDNTIINVQASDFDTYQSQSGRIVDNLSANKGKQLYNKEVAAGLLYQHYNAYSKLKGLSLSPINNTEELGQLALRNDSSTESQLANELFHRSASLVAAQFAGFYYFRNKPEKLVFIMEGSLFWDGPNYQEIVKQQLVNFGVPEEVIGFKRIENSAIIGGIKLVTG